MLKRRSFIKKDIVMFVRKCFPKQLFLMCRSVKRFVWPYKGARVFIRKGITRTQFFDCLNERNIEYVLLRWWHDFPIMPAGEDMDILIKDEHRDLITDLLTFRDYGTDLKCDIYTVEGSRFGSHRELPYFQNRLSRYLLETRQLFRGVYVPGGLAYFSSLAYHALFHKGNGSGLSGFTARPENLEHNYSTILESEAKHLGLQVTISAQGIYEWLSENHFVPAEDTLCKLVEIRPELSSFQKSLYSDIRGGELMAFVIRDRLLSDGHLPEFTRFLKDMFKFRVIDVKILDDRQKAICKSEIRGGKWDEGPYKSSGGPPVAFVLAFDPEPWPLDEIDFSAQPRMTNRKNLQAKYKFRKFINGSALIDYNGLHSADNELDAFAYISLLDDEYSNKIASSLELLRIDRSENDKQREGRVINE